MTALILVYSAAGLVGRCDRLCYDALHEVCRCVCFGRNHGKGREQAEINSRELAEMWHAMAARLAGRPLDRVETGPAVSHDSLF